MKVNERIIFDYLSEKIPIKMYGRSPSSLHLIGPRIHDGHPTILRGGYVHVVTPEALAERPKVERGAAIIVAGNLRRLPSGPCCCTMTCDQLDALTVFSSVQDVFFRFAEFDAAIHEALETTADVREMLKAGSAILGNPIILLDSSFRRIADSSSMAVQANRGPFDDYLDEDGCIKGASWNLEGRPFDMKLSEPFEIRSPDGGFDILCTNLFVQGTNVGSMTIHFRNRPLRPSDKVITSYLARMVERAFAINPELFSTHTRPLQGILKDLLSGESISADQRWILESESSQGPFVCMKIIPEGSVRDKISNSHVAQQIETRFPSSIVLEHDGSVVAILPQEALSCLHGDILQRFVDTLRLKVALSNPFMPLQRIPSYYRQASLAMEIGIHMHPGQNHYLFDDYKLDYLIEAALSEFPLEDMLSPGLVALVEHDRTAGVSYEQTLRIYLGNNMNISQTSRDLYIHRSSLIERLRRIERILGVDLCDSDARLFLLIMLKALELSR